MRSRIPAGVRADLVGGVVVDRAGDVAVRVRLFHGRGPGVDLHRGDQLQAAARGRGPAGGKPAKVARVLGVDVGDRFDDRPAGHVVGRVVDRAVGVHAPGGLTEDVVVGGRGLGRAGAVLRRGDHRQGGGFRLRLHGFPEPGVAVGGGFGPRAVAVAVHGLGGLGVDGCAAAADRVILLRLLQHGRAELTLLDLRVLEIPGRPAGRGGGGRGLGVIVGQLDQARVVGKVLVAPVLVHQQVRAGLVIAGDGRWLGLFDQAALRVILVEGDPLVAVQARVARVADVLEHAEHHLAKAVGVVEVLVAVGQGFDGLVLPGVGVGGCAHAQLVDRVGRHGGTLGIGKGVGADAARCRPARPLHRVQGDAALRVVLEVLLRERRDLGVGGGKGETSDIYISEISPLKTRLTNKVLPNCRTIRTQHQPERPRENQRRGQGQRPSARDASRSGNHLRHRLVAVLGTLGDHLLEYRIQFGWHFGACCAERGRQRG